MSTRKFCLFLVTSLILISGVYALPFSFDFENPTLLRTFEPEERVKAFQSEDGSWYLGYIDSSDSKIYIEEFNSGFSSQGRYTESNGFCFDSSDCASGDITYYQDDLGNEYIRVVGLEQDTYPRLEIYDYDINSGTASLITTEGSGTTPIYGANKVMIDVSGYEVPIVAVDDEILIGVRKTLLSVDWRYSNDNNFGSQLNGDGSIDFFSSYDDPDDSQVAWCNDHYYIGAFNDTSKGLFIHSFELDAFNELEFIGTTLGIASGGGTNMSIDDWNFYVENGDSGTDILHMVSLDKSEKKIYFNSWECQDNGKLVNIQTVNNDYSDLADVLDITQISGSQGNLGDSGVRQDTPNTNYGSNTLLTVKNDDTNYRRSYLKFNISEIYQLRDVITSIDSAELCVYKSRDDNSVNNISVYHVISDNWDESTITWNNQPCGTGFDNSTACDLTPTDSLDSTGDNDLWKCFDVMDIIEDDYDSDTNTSFVIKSLENDVGGDREEFHSKENTNDPYLNITYTYIQDIEIEKPFLTKDNDNNLFRLFYMYQEDGGAWELLSIGNFGDCACNEWIGQDVCEYDKQKFTRTCSPVGCESNTTYWATTSYCQKQYNETEGIFVQNYEYKSGDSFCESDWVEAGQEAKCYPDPLTIPINCVNITAFSITSGNFEGNDRGRGNVTIQACTPSVDCDVSEITCEDVFNNSINWLRDTEDTFYSAGDVVTGLSTLRVDLSCADNGILDFTGIKRYKVYGSILYTCQVACEDEWVCLDPFTSAYKRIDCSYTNTTSCENGCTDGECTPDVPEIEKEGSIANPLTLINLILNPTEEQKFMLSMFFCVVAGVFVSSLSKEGEKGILFLTGFGIGFAIFTGLGWINWIISLVMVFFVVAYGFLKNMK